MLKYCSKKLRTHAANIMSETSGDNLRNSIADGFIDVARAIEKLDAPIEQIVNEKIFMCSILSGFISASSVLIVILVLKLLRL